MEPVIEKLWSGWDEKYALEFEAALIAIWKRRCDGGTLTNFKLRGDGVSGYSPTEETRRKIGLASKGHKMPESQRLRLIETNTGTKRSAESRLRMSESHKGKKGHPVSEETKKKLSLANKGHVCTEEARRHQSEVLRARALKGLVSPRLGMKHSAEALRKMSIAKKGRRLGPPSEETKRKISEAHKGKKHSAETLQKMSIAKKGIPGHPTSEETKLKLSGSAKKRCAMEREEESPPKPFGVAVRLPAA